MYIGWLRILEKLWIIIVILVLLSVIVLLMTMSMLFAWRWTDFLVLCKVFVSQRKSLLLIIYKFRIRSLLEFGCILWCPYRLYLSEQIERVKDHFTRLFPDLQFLPYHLPYTSIFIYFSATTFGNHLFLLSFLGFAFGLNLSLSSNFLNSKISLCQKKLPKILTNKDYYYYHTRIW